MTARLPLAQNLFGSVVNYSPDFFWIFQHRKMAGRESRGCFIQLHQFKYSYCKPTSKIVGDREGKSE
jgi:hypothetical protein